jgi:hypothetical protein
MPDYNAWAAIGAVASAVTSVFAAVAAMRSAASARDASTQAAQQRRDDLWREASRLQARIAASAAHIQEIATSLESSYATLFTFAGHTRGSSRLTAFKADIALKRSETESVLEESRQVSLPNLVQHTTEGLASAVRTLDSYIVRLERIDTGLTMELQSVDAQVRVYQEQEAAIGQFSRLPPPMPK